MDKKYYWKINGYLYEVTKEKYFEYKEEQNRHDYLKRNEEEAVILSLDSLGHEGKDGECFIADPNVNVEEEVIQKILLDKLRSALKGLSEEELHLIEQAYSYEKSEREIAAELGISQKAVNKRKTKLLAKLRESLKL